MRSKYWSPTPKAVIISAPWTSIFHIHRALGCRKGGLAYFRAELSEVGWGWLACKCVSNSKKPNKQTKRPTNCNVSVILKSVFDMGEGFLNVTISRLFYRRKTGFTNGLLSSFSLVAFSLVYRRDWGESWNGRKETSNGLVPHLPQTPGSRKSLLLCASLCWEVGAVKRLMDRTSPGGQKQVE